MLIMDSLQVAEEEVVEFTTNKFEDIYRFLSEGAFPPSFCSTKRKNLKRYAQKFITEGGCLYYVGSKKEEKREVVADPQRRHQIFLASHLTDAGHHLGQKKTVHRIQRHYYWLGIVKDVIDRIKMCETCQNAEQNKNICRKLHPVEVHFPWEVLGLEVHGPFPETTRGNTCLVTVTDYFTKWIEAIPVQKKDTMSVARALAAVFYRFGAAKNIYSRQSWDFCEEVSRHLCERWNITQTVTPASSVTHTPLDNKTNDQMKAAIRSIVSENKEVWDECLDPVFFEFRTTPNSVTKCTPFFLLYNREARISSEVELLHVQESKQHEVCCGKSDRITSLQEQQDSIKEFVMSNMAAAYRHERKKSKRRARTLSSLTFKVDSKVFGSSTSPTQEKLRKMHLSFQLESGLPDQESMSEVKKSK